MTKMTNEREEAFLAALRDGSSVTAAAAVIGMSRGYMYQYRDANPEFAAAWDDAAESGVDSLEDVAITRAKSGSDPLLMFLLKARRRFVYGDKTQIEQKTEISGPGGAAPAFIMYGPGERPKDGE